MKMIQNIVSALAMTLLLPLGLTAGVRITTIEASKYGVLPGRTHDSGPGLTALLSEARALSEQGDSVVIRFAPGEYAVHEQSLPRETIFISNHDHHEERAVALLLRQLRHTRIEAEGVTLLAHGRLLPVVVSDCSDLTISGLTIDYPEPTLSQLEILSIEGDEVEAGLHNLLNNDRWDYTTYGLLTRQTVSRQFRGRSLLTLRPK